MALRARPAGRPRWRPRAPARDIVERLAPRAGDYFIIKPQFSGFYATNLQVLLPKLGVRRLILVGMAADICVLFTAADAHMRDYDLWIPADAVAGEDAKRTAWALEVMRASMGARIAAIQGGGLSDWREDAPNRPARPCPAERWRRPGSARRRNSRPRRSACP
jgi:nicotinamidase-related amidase